MSLPLFYPSRLYPSLMYPHLYLSCLYLPLAPNPEDRWTWLNGVPWSEVFANPFSSMVQIPRGAESRFAEVVTEMFGAKLADPTEETFLQGLKGFLLCARWIPRPLPLHKDRDGMSARVCFLRRLTLLEDGKWSELHAAVPSARRPSAESPAEAAERLAMCGEVGAAYHRLKDGGGAVPITENVLTELRRKFPDAPALAPADVPPTPTSLPTLMMISVLQS